MAATKKSRLNPLFQLACWRTSDSLGMDDLRSLYGADHSTLPPLSKSAIDAAEGLWVSPVCGVSKFVLRMDAIRLPSLPDRSRLGPGASKFRDAVSAESLPHRSRVGTSSR